MYCVNDKYIFNTYQSSIYAPTVCSPLTTTTTTFSSGCFVRLILLCFLSKCLKSKRIFSSRLKMKSFHLTWNFSITEKFWKSFWFWFNRKQNFVSNFQNCSGTKTSILHPALSFLWSLFPLMSLSLNFCTNCLQRGKHYWESNFKI